MTAEPQWSPIDDDTADLLALVSAGSLALTAEDEWRHYLAALLKVADGTGLISQNDLRAHLTPIAPARRGSFMCRAKGQRILIETGQFDVNDDVKSRNRGRPQRLVRLTLHGAAEAAAAARVLGGAA